ncbi:efflux transporter outer membrane subunit [Hydrogenophaga sp.]|uniref:efflux transporter outer membrane subunit n=1 Tax=Hydrogenophaga sp. TaxID=1904254 RepID=UPI003568AEAC
MTHTTLHARRSQPGGLSLAWMLALLLSGCASLTPPPRDLGTVAVPSAWSVPSAQAAGVPSATDLATWWQRFDDPALTALVTQALQANTSVKSAQAALLQARAQADVQQAGLGPSVGTSASAQRSQSGNNSASNRFQAGFDASWEPDIFGGNRSAAQASETDAQASAASLANVQVSLAAEVATNYINLRGLQTRLAIASSNLATQSETLQITRWRAQAGLVSSLDVEQAVSATEQTRAQIPALQTSVSQALNALAVLTGQAPGALNVTLGKAAPIPPAPADLALAFPTDTLRQRPDVRAAELRAQAAWSRVAVADAARYPSFKLSGSLGLSALTLGALTDGASLLKSVLAGVSMPLFDGGAAKAQVRVQEAALQQARVAYEAAVLTALQDVEDALVAIQGDRERLTRLQAAASAAANAELLARQRYESGLIDFATVLSTQRSLLSAQDSVASTQASLGADHVRLYKALGGGWTPDAATPPEPALGAQH